MTSTIAPSSRRVVLIVRCSELDKAIARLSAEAHSMRTGKDAFGNAHSFEARRGAQYALDVAVAQRQIVGCELALLSARHALEETIKRGPTSA